MTPDAVARPPAPFLSPKARLRLFWLAIHRWIGLGLLIVMFAFGVTGSLLVWPETFDSWVNPARYPDAQTAGFTPTAGFLSRARAALPPGDRISGVRIPEGRGAILVGGQVNGPPPLHLGPPSRAQVWLHPQTGAVLDTQGGAGGFTWALRAIHGHLLLAGVGRTVVALAGLALTISAAIGLWLWWPGARNLLRALRWRRTYTNSLNLHRQSGALLAVVIIVEAVTGAYIALPRLFAALVEPGAPAGRAAPEGPPREPTLASPRLTLEQAVARARAVGGARALRSVFLPTTARPVWAVVLAGVAGPVSVRVDDATGVARRVPPQPRGRAMRVVSLMERTHAGDLGVVWQVIVFLSGIALSLLSVTGFLMWLRGGMRPAKPPRPA